ncbi:MAG: TatD family hydrolase [Chloroflexi bacterium]|nr:TatD family hydrolase [Chloroflexota bacterium]
MALADAHTHLEQFAAQEIPGILQRAQQVGVACIIVAGVTEESSQRVIALAEEHQGVYAGVGIQPSDVKGPLDARACQRLKALAHSNPKVVCISEVGLDFAPGMPSLEWQRQALRQQVRLARELGLPVIFHSRERPGHIADHYETLKVLAEEKVEEVGGAFHYFQWSQEIAQACFDLGLYVSIAKPLLRLPALQAVVKDLPLERLVLETDSYPQPFKRNRLRWTEPKDVLAVAEKIAELKGILLEAVARATTGNLLRLLKGKVAIPTEAP